jgi:addiction module HigA family antidote
MHMRFQPHPGEIVRTLCLEPLGLSVTRAAAALGITRRELSALLDGRSRVSAEMAIRLSKAFGGSPESWLMQQVRYDLWCLKPRLRTIKVKRIPAA